MNPKTYKKSNAKIEDKFAQTLRALLKAHNITQTDLAKQLGIHPQTVSLYCMDKRYPDIPMMIRIAEFFDVDIHFLITGDKDRDKYIINDLGLPSPVIDLLLKVKNGEFNEGVNLSSVLYLLLQDREFLNTLFITSSILKESYEKILKIDGNKSDLNDKDISAESIKASIAFEKLSYIKSIVSSFFYHFFTQHVYYDDLVVPGNISVSDLSSIPEIFLSLGYANEKEFKNVLNKIKRPR